MLWNADADDRVYAARHNLLKLRRLVRQYREDHNGRCPSDLIELTQSSNATGETSGTCEVSVSYPIAPYLQMLPENSISRVAGAQRVLVRRIFHDPPRVSDVTPDSQGGWLYNPQTGRVWIDHPHFLSL